MKRIFFSWSLTLVGFLSAFHSEGNAFADEARVKLRVLAIGINDYQTSQTSQSGSRMVPLTNLNFGAFDAKELGSVLEQLTLDNSKNENDDAQQVVDQKQIITMTDDSSPDMRPTFENVQRVLQEMGKHPSDVWMVFFFGHGVKIGDENYWCLADTQIRQDPSRPDQYSIEQGLSVQVIFDAMASADANTKVLVTDACRQIGTPEDLSDVNLQGVKNYDISKHLTQMTQEQRVGQRMIVSSCLPGQVALETPTMKHGIFAYHLINGLKGECDFDAGNRDGKVSLNELFSYAARKTKKDAFDMEGRKQLPFIEGAQTDEVVLASLGEDTLAALREKFANVSFDFKELSFRQQQAHEDFGRALEAFSLLDIGSCIEFCTSVINELPAHREARKLRAICWSLSGKTVDAIKELQSISKPLKARVYSNSQSSLGLRAADNPNRVIAPFEKGDVLEISTYSAASSADAEGKYLFVSRMRKKGTDEWMDASGIVLADIIKPQTDNDRIELIQDSQKFFGNVQVNSADEIAQNRGVQGRGVVGGGALLGSIGSSDALTTVTRGLALANAIQSGSPSSIITAVTGNDAPVVRGIEQGVNGNWQGAVQNIAPGAGEVMNRVNRVRGIIGF
jgi:uncharacterized caspase-like protein